MGLDNMFMLRTANSEVYKELVTINKYFTRQVHLFVTGLAIGIAKNIRSIKKPNHDIVRLVILETHLKIFKEAINLLSEIICLNMDEKNCGSLILSYADGGIEFIWNEYKTQGILDLPRIFEEVKDAWPDEIDKIFKNLEAQN